LGFDGRRDPGVGPHSAPPVIRTINHEIEITAMSVKPTEAEVVEFLKDLLSYSDSQLSGSPKSRKALVTGRARYMSKAKELLTRLEPQTFKTDLERSVESLDLPVRAKNMLVTEGLSCVGDLLKCTGRDILKLPGCGRSSFKAIEAVLAEYGGLKDYVPTWHKEHLEPGK
jgi:DNA-directed RNA polymerase alpha subunit